MTPRNSYFFFLIYFLSLFMLHGCGGGGGGGSDDTVASGSADNPSPEPENNLTFWNELCDDADSCMVEIDHVEECNNSDKMEILCENVFVTVHVPDHLALDNSIPGPVNMIFSVRRGIDNSLDNRWIVLDVGGKGGGYGKQSGRLGDYKENTGGYADDLIREYNDLGYVTIDLVWYCDEDREQCSEAQKEWVRGYFDDNGDELAVGWMKDTHGLGYQASSLRLYSIYSWIRHHNGNKQVGSHAHSSGSGRLITALLRFGLDEFVETAVFDGGPVFSYIPWYCETDAGPLGPMPHTDEFARRYVLSDLLPGGGRKYIFDLTVDQNNGFDRFDFCTNRVFHDSMLDSSALLMRDKDSLDVNIGVVLGGLDNSPANSHLRLWLQGYDARVWGGPVIQPLDARTVNVVQGYCNPDSPETYQQQGRINGVSVDFPCSYWQPDEFPQVDLVSYDESLANVTHSTSASPSGMQIMRDLMLKTFPGASL